MDGGEKRRPKPIVLWIVLILIGVLSCLPALMSPMLGDDPKQPRIPTLVLILCVASFPISCLASVAVSWRLAARGLDGPSWRVLAVPLVNLIVGALAVGWIQLAHGG